MSAHTEPMDPERLADLREAMADNRGGAELPVPLDLACELLADRDRLAAEVKRLDSLLADALLATMPASLLRGD